MKIKKRLNNFIKSILNQLPYIKNLHRLNSNCVFPNGHFYSTVNSIEDIKNRQSEIWSDLDNIDIPGIDLNVEEQLKLFNSLSNYFKELPFKPEKQLNHRYHFTNNYYSYNDGVVLYSMIRHFKPKRIIEIGSGYSSANMLDTNELFFNKKILK